MPTWLPIASLVVSVVFPLLAWWGTLREQSGRRDAWEKQFEATTREWRESVSRRMENIETRLGLSTRNGLETRVATAEREIERLRGWKHEKADPHISAMAELNRRMAAFDRLLEQHAADDQVVAAAVEVLKARMAGRSFR